MAVAIATSVYYFVYVLAFNASTSSIKSINSSELFPAPTFYKERLG
jgi:hypothetical protein